ncbi:MAG: hypothetical protein R3E08_11805 [Thiotrichaceae bacterium]
MHCHQAINRNLLPNSTIDFGNVPVNTPSQKTLTIQEIGNAALIINTIKIISTDAAAFSLRCLTYRAIFHCKRGADNVLTIQCLATQAINTFCQFTTDNQ